MSISHETMLFSPSVFPPPPICYDMKSHTQTVISRMPLPHVKVGDMLFASRIDLSKDWSSPLQNQKNVHVLHIPQVKISAGGGLVSILQTETSQQSTVARSLPVKAEPQSTVVRSLPVKAEPRDDKPTENVVQRWVCRKNSSEESVATSPRVPAATASQARCESLSKPDPDGEVENGEVVKKEWKEMGKSWKEKEETECEPVSPLQCQGPSSMDETDDVWLPFAPTVSEVTRVKPPSEAAVRAGFSRSCSTCGTRKTPLWRDGPTGPKSLCNACGLRHQRGRPDGKYHKRKTTKDSKKLHKKSAAGPKQKVNVWARREDSGNGGSDSGTSTKEVSGITAVSSGGAPASKCLQAVRGSSPLSSMGASGQSADKSWKRVKRPSEKALESKLVCHTGLGGRKALPSWQRGSQCYRCMAQYKFQLRDGLCNSCFHRMPDVPRSPPSSSGDESEDVDLRMEPEDEVEMEIVEDKEEEEEVVPPPKWGAVHKRKRMTCTAEHSPAVRRRYYGSFPALMGDSSDNSSPCESDDAAVMESGELKSGGMSPVDMEEDKALSRSGSAVDLTKLARPACDVQRIAEEMAQLEQKIGEKMADTDKMGMEWKHGKRVPVESPRAVMHSSKQFPGKRIKLIYGGGKVRPMKRCVCCQAEATPQWREGPKGPKTLCNACGLRFAKGRVCNHHRPSKASSGMKKLKLSFGSMEKVKKEEDEDRDFVPRETVHREPALPAQGLGGLGLGLEVEGKRRRKKINRAALDEELERGDREARNRSKKAKQNRKKAEKTVKKMKKATDSWSFGSPSCADTEVQGSPASGTVEGDKRGLVPQIRRRCTHCFQDRTPLWREGPLGPKTLCNACGIMHKRGRLDPSKCHPVSEMDDDMPIMGVDFGRGKAKGGSCGKAGAPKKPRAVKEGALVKPKKPRAKKGEEGGKAQRQRQCHTSGLSMIPMDIGLGDWAEGLGELDDLRRGLGAKLGSETESDDEDYPRLAGRASWGKGKKTAGDSDWSSEGGLSGLWAQDSFDADEEGLLDDLPDVRDLLDSDDIIGLGSGEFPWIFGDPLDNLDTVTQCDVENWEVTENWIETERASAQAVQVKA